MSSESPGGTGSRNRCFRRSRRSRPDRRRCRARAPAIRSRLPGPPQLAMIFPAASNSSTGGAALARCRPARSRPVQDPHVVLRVDGDRRNFAQDPAVRNGRPVADHFKGGGSRRAGRLRSPEKCGNDNRESGERCHERQVSRTGTYHGLASLARPGWASRLSSAPGAHCRFEHTPGASLSGTLSDGGTGQIAPSIRQRSWVRKELLICRTITSRQRRTTSRQRGVREKAEGGRQDAEQNRGFTERRRVSAESARSDAEEFRRLAEEARVIRDQHRDALKTVRQEQERLRQAEELARAAGEEARVAAEQPVAQPWKLSTRRPKH